jgi:septal ring factor EnvC (AmiA/AmiB activator)
VGVCATDDGDLVTFTYHASPVPESAVIRQRIAEAVAAHNARKQADKDERDTLKAQLADARGKLAAVETEVEKLQGKKQEVTK